MHNEIIDLLMQGGHVTLRQRIRRGHMTVDTELSSRPIGISALAKLEKAGIIKKRKAIKIQKGCQWDYELATKWINEDELPKNYPYSAMFPFSVIPGGVGCRLFPDVQTESK